MNTQILKTARLVAFTAASLTLIAQAHALTSFSDNFNSGASALWGNEVGAWAAAGGVYKATSPGFMPPADSSLPFNLADFTVDFDINNVNDGGIWLRSSAAPSTAFGIKGVLLALKTTDGPARIYWHIDPDGTTEGSPTNVTVLAYGNNPHIHVEVSGNTYKAFVNGSPTPATTLTTGLFASGQVALYDNSLESFDNFVLQEVPEPSAAVLFIAGTLGGLCWTRGKRNQTLSLG